MTITIADGRGALWQWDTGRRVKITDGDGVKQIHYQNKCFGLSVDVDVGDDGTAIIPDELLQDYHRLTAYAYATDDTGAYTMVQQDFTVYKRAKPADYVYTPMEHAGFDRLRTEIGDLADLTTTEKSTLVAAINEVALMGGRMCLRVADGYIQYSTDSGSTWENLIAMADLKGGPGAPGKDGADGNTPVKGTDYWTASDKAEVVAEAAAAIDLTSYAKKNEVPTKTSQLTNDSGFLTSHQDISGKQDKSTLEADVAAKGFTKNTGTYSKPDGGIPKADLAAAVQTSLGKADTALQSHQSLAAYRTAAAQDEIDSGKVDKVDGKGLSTNDYTAAAKAKVDAIPANPKYTDTVYDDAALKERVATIESKESVWDAKSDFSGSYNDLTDKPTPLTGTTGMLTPAQVHDAVSDGIPVIVQYLDSTYGFLSFTTFNIAESLYMIVSQTIVYYNGVYILAELSGAIRTGIWTFNSTVLAEKTDIPASLKNPNALTIKIGSTTVTYDGSTAETVEIADGTEVSY